MINHYDILGITENANLDEIKAAYKRLAKQYHPDLNPSLQAEDKFKLVAHAYNILSNIDSRSKFDSILTHQRLAKARAYAKAKRPYPPSYTYQGNFHANRGETVAVDKRKERLGTLYAIGIIGIVALFIYIASTIIDHYQIQQREKLEASISSYFSKAESYYLDGQQQAALLTVDSLRGFVAEHASMESFTYSRIRKLKDLAELHFREKAYKQAAWGMLLYMQYTGNQDQQMLYDLAVAYKAVDEFEKATYILHTLLNNNFRRIYTMSLMADIYHFDLNNAEVALTYYEMALKTIEADFIATYGKAYRLFVSEEKTPYIYKKIYRNSAILFYQLGEYRKARKLLEWVIFFEPEKAQSYKLLVKTYQKLEQEKSACRIIKKAKKHKIDLSNLNVICNA